MDAGPGAEPQTGAHRGQKTELLLNVFVTVSYTFPDILLMPSDSCCSDSHLSDVILSICWCFI